MPERCCFRCVLCLSLTEGRPLCWDCWNVLSPRRLPSREATQ